MQSLGVQSPTRKEPDDVINKEVIKKIILVGRELRKDAPELEAIVPVKSNKHSQGIWRIIRGQFLKMCFSTLDPLQQIL